MSTSMSATHWGSPIAPKRALLIHGLTMSSQSWEGIAQLLVAEGYSGFFVVAPNLLGHAWRRGGDYRVSTLAEDLRPYFAVDMSYDVIIGHSLGGIVAVSLFPFLPKTKETTVILADPPLELTVEQFQQGKNSTWLRTLLGLEGDSMLRALGVYMCDRTVVKGIFEHNKPYAFGGRLKNIPPHVKVALLVSDPGFGSVCHLERIPVDEARLNVKVLNGIGHWIQYELPSAIMDEIPLPRAKLFTVYEHYLVHDNVTRNTSIE
ncbi:Alpha/Beta hydrolase protein [Suillus subalutaceus]|uniref:Alpha/Beta hydrolase protein n=1 Tax=Suillus subalutaceus TaxID=48586 RepID=UPI001B86D319|nr:Alpha/Beta hydrolase protein [Suillus subalutaceus]KAG1874705.1 Alpha/Beta hydrolase protein [Suillus subalutaceus]